MNNAKNIQYTFNTVYHELKLQKDAKEKLAKLAKEIETLFRAEGILGKVETEHHMTLSYQQNITADQLSKSLVFIDEIRKSLENFELLNPHKTFDQSLHQIKARESFDNGQVYIVLTPHNGESVYKEMVFSEEASPHITLAKVPCSLEIVQHSLLPKIKNLFKPYIQDRGIAVDPSEIITHIK